jgi:hypothetical protein
VTFPDAGRQLSFWPIPDGNGFVVLYF